MSSRFPSPKHILLTGATGMVGSHLLAKLLHRRRKVAVLVRPTSEATSQQRLETVLQRFGCSWDAYEDQIRILSGDLVRPGLGLEEQDQAWLVNRIGEVLHCAASLSFRPASESTDNEPYRSNVDGTQHLIDLCQRIAPTSFHYVSTAYVCGAKRGVVLEVDADGDVAFSNDYENSKCQAEAMVRSMCPDLPVTIYRPSIVIDSTGRSPVTNDRTVYGAYQTYRMLASKFGLPEGGSWFRNLGFSGSERKNLIEADWVAESLLGLMEAPRCWGGTYHLTAPKGTAIEEMEMAFRNACLQSGDIAESTPANVSAQNSSIFHTMAAPYVQTFLPYFNDDPVFDQQRVNQALSEIGLPFAQDVSANHLESLLSPRHAAALEDATQSEELVVVGYDVTLPGTIRGADAFESVLFDNRSVIDEIPAERFDRSLYFDSRRGTVGKAYTTLGGCVDESALDPEIVRRAQDIGEFDECHLHFASVATSAWRRSGIPAGSGLENHCGIYVGHSGGTKRGGPLAMATLASDAAKEALRVGDRDGNGISGPVALDTQMVEKVAQEMRSTRSMNDLDRDRHFNAYSAASLTARLMGLGGIREVIDAACASSLVALRHASVAINQGRIDAAIVGGATYNNVDNLILFSQSQACSDQGSCPFDDRASGLISSEGYVAVVVTKRSIADSMGLPILATIESVGVATDGRGKSLWAPRTEGQQLAIRRAYTDDDKPLAIDYMECHATSTQVGDATELESLTEIRGGHRSNGNRNGSPDSQPPLLIGSAKSNLGHTLEAAGLVGLVKVLLAMKRGIVPASIRFRQPTGQFDWQSGQVRVAEQNQKWPQSTERVSKRAAVNAFGIGGLNAHALIKQDASPPSQETTAASRAQSSVSPRVPNAQTRPNRQRRSRRVEGEPIALVGRGLVLPSAFHLSQFEERIANGQSAIEDPSPERWPLSDEIQPAVCGHQAIPHRKAGYIRGYQFDGYPYRIPPKQVELANPVQMMLIDAVRQALNELGEPADFHVEPGQGRIARERTSVVVGTIFGGEFSNQLQVGMRIPELCQRFADELRKQGCDQAAVEAWVTDYRSHLLNRYPAILDETGSFTASTLASRIAKTFDFMGGACALDADDASGMLALMTAVDQLRSGDVDHVICGVAQRSLDQVSFEQLHRRGQLLESGDPNDVPDNGSQVIPGEGVAVLVLQRERDAKDQGIPVLGRIGSITTALSQNTARTKSDWFARDPHSADLIRQFGYLAGAHEIIRLIAHSCRQSDDRVPSGSAIEIGSVAEDGWTICGEFEAVHHRDARDSNGRSRNAMKIPPVTDLTVPRPTRANNATRPADRSDNHSTVTPGNTLHEQVRYQSLTIQADSLVGIGRQLREKLSNPVAWLRDGLKSTNHTGPSMARVNPDGAKWTLGLVTADAESLTKQIEQVVASIEKSPKVGVIDAANAFLWSTGSALNRVGWLFPGQGSQYSRTPSMFQCDPTAWQALARVDDVLAEIGLESVSDRLSDPQRQLGKDIWWTQLWILAVSHCMADSLGRGGVPCDVVSGHSFGECGAALHAGSMSLEQAIRFSRQRSDAVLMSVREKGQLLSVRASASRVAAVLQEEQSSVVITHQNAPEQTVIAGTQRDIAATKKLLNKAGLASVVISVPAAFHTPTMKEAENVLRSGFQGERLRPPSCGLLSAVSLNYLAEPDDIRDNLIQQLTRPVLFQSCLQRMVQDGCGLLIEVGPGDVLTRLARESVGQQTLCLSLDNGGEPNARLALIKLAAETVSGKHNSSNSVSRTVEASIGSPSQETSRESSVTVLDLTTNRRNGEGQDKASNRSHPAVEQNGSTAGSGFGWNASPETNHVGSQGNSDHRSDIPSMNDRSDRNGPPVETDVSVARTSCQQSEHIESFLVDLVVELTGYHPEVIDFQADLEAELGVDSIKKAQVIGELAEWASITLDLNSMKLADYNSLADIAALHPDWEAVPMEQKAMATEMAAVPSQVSQTSVAQPVTRIDPVSGNHPAGNASTADSMASLMIDFVVDQTGYPVDVVDLDADLEAELGLDSIKKAQLLGELQEQFDLSKIDLGQVKLADFATLRSIQAFVLSHLGESIDDEKKNTPSDHLEPSLTIDPAREESLDSVARDVSPIPANGTCRFTLQTVRADRVPGSPSVPRLVGPALVLGENEVATQIESACKRMGLTVYRPGNLHDLPAVDDWLDTVWQQDETPHLFLTTPRDHDALSDLSGNHWRTRRERALAIPFRICQRWMQRMIDTDQMKRATLVSVVNAGGQFGFDSQKPDTSHLPSPESGGIAGLTKAMRIESWMRGFRETPMLVVDSQPSTTPQNLVDGIWRELAAPSYDEEVVVDGEKRWTVDVDYEPLEIAHAESIGDSARITRGGTWIVSGGGRGITALTAGELAKRHDLHLHLLGTAPKPMLDPATRQSALENRSELRRQVMRQAQEQGENPIETWRDLEKAIEIDQTLQQFQREGIRAEYHCVDVSDADQVHRVCETIRQTDGPIRGVLHGAGAGQDARFDRKRPDKVAKCIGAKVDGCIHLADATDSDPLEWFVGFGSISGRFGANGHTDYSLANDMLSKCIDRLRIARPDVRAVTFHWHAWGDIGMAAKPEAKLALEMIGMEFMPAEEGLEHFLRELESGGDRSEILITDRRYVRKFFPGRFMLAPTSEFPMLDRHSQGLAIQNNYSITLDPEEDRFLSQHRVGQRPTLPFVMAIEMMAEAACHLHPGSVVLSGHDLEAIQAIKFASQDAMAVEIVREEHRFPSENISGLATTKASQSPGGGWGESVWTLRADLRRQDGRMVQEGRIHFQGRFQCGAQRDLGAQDSESLVESHGFHWEPIEYLPEDAAVFHGESLQCLREIAWLPPQGTDPTSKLFGRITTPSPAHLGGEDRPLAGWQLPCAVTDACFYAAAVLAYRMNARASLPVRIRQLDFGRTPLPGEPLQIHWECMAADEKGMDLAGCLLGINGDVILRFDQYRVGWLHG